jgi:vacuolar-type H+-ATPase subunit I/STV1
LFRIDAKRRNRKRNENEIKLKQNKKEAETAVIFASKRNISENFFASLQKMCFFRLFSHLERNKKEIKQKQNEKEAETAKRKRIK